MTKQKKHELRQGWGQCQWALALVPRPAAVPLPSVLPATPPAALPCFRAAFDETPGKLAYFLNQIWSHLDCHGDQYQSDQDMVLAIADNMEDNAAEWIAKLHNQRASELGDADEFVEMLRTRFEDTGQGQETETEIKDLKQRGTSVRVLKSGGKAVGLARTSPGPLFQGGPGPRPPTGRHLPRHP
ncbi:hypothetical protein L345_02679, partial [Ophiophagus hannah]